MGDMAELLEYWCDDLWFEEEWQKLQKRIEKRLWVTGDGEEIHISKMDTDHIRNALRWIQRWDIPDFGPYIRLFEDELKRRMANS